MPVVVTFDLKNPSSSSLNRIRGFFERLGWERLGNTAYRYPKLHGQHPTEDWFNHVIPALMLLRSFCALCAADRLHRGAVLHRCSKFHGIQPRHWGR